MSSSRENTSASSPKRAEIVHDAAWNHLERVLLPEWIPARRWFRAKSRAVERVALEARIPLAETPHPVVLAIANVAFREGPAERYLLPLARVSAPEATDLPEAARIGTVDGDATDAECVWIDASWDAGFRAALAKLLAGATATDAGTDASGALHGEPVGSGGARAALEDPAAGVTSRVLSAEQSNTALVYGDRVFVKLYRRLETGTHPEPEMLRFLRERTAFRDVPAYVSALHWAARDGGVSTVALAQEFTPGDDAWGQLLAALNGTASGTPPAEAVRLAARLGTAVGGLHAALAGGAEPDFAPERLTAREVEDAADAVLRQLDSGLADAARLRDDAAAALAREAHDTRGRLRELVRAAAAKAGAGSAPRTRIHGDLHLGQILMARADGSPRILDFEGEPGRPLADARRKRSPLRDAAGMLRSFHYAAHVADRAGSAPDPERADAVAEALSTAFLETYARAFPAAGLDPAPADTPLLRLHVLEKAAYELRYELDNRPDWAAIPLLGLRSLARAAG